MAWHGMAEASHRRRRQVDALGTAGRSGDASSTPAIRRKRQGNATLRRQLTSPVGRKAKGDES